MRVGDVRGVQGLVVEVIGCSVIRGLDVRRDSCFRSFAKDAAIKEVWFEAINCVNFFDGFTQKIFKWHFETCLCPCIGRTR